MIIKGIYRHELKRKKDSKESDAIGILFICWLIWFGSAENSLVILPNQSNPFRKFGMMLLCFSWSLIETESQLNLVQLVWSVLGQN